MGIDEISVRWVASFLSERKVQIVIDGRDKQPFKFVEEE